MYTSFALRAQRLGMSAAEIRQLRRRLDWTQARLALVLGVYRLTIGRVPVEADHAS
jgi:DNA-binding XRE family transcriptional regulator